MLLLTFTVGANRYAIDVARVVEVVPRVKLREISHAPAPLAGLLDYRGKIVPVIDLGILLGAAGCRDLLSTRIILVNDLPDGHDRIEQGRDDGQEDTEGARLSLERGLKLLGLVAEQVTDLTSPRPEQVVPSPVSLPQAPYLGAIVHTDQGLVQLVVAEKVRGASLGSTYLDRSATLKTTA